MVPKKWTMSALAALLIIFILAGFAVVAAEYGSSDDPLVSFSYISEVLMPNLSKTIDTAVSEKTQEVNAQLDKKILDFTAEIESKIASAQTGAALDTSDQTFINAVADAVIEKTGGAQSAAPSGGAAADTYKVVDVANGKTLTGKVGTELLLRIGSGTCVAPSSPGLINITTGTDLASGKALAQNNLYIVTVDGRGFKATANVKVLVRGEYTIS